MAGEWARAPHDPCHEWHCPFPTPQPEHPLTHPVVQKPRRPILEFTALNISVCGLFSLKLGFSMSDIKAFRFIALNIKRY